MKKVSEPSLLASYSQFLSKNHSETKSLIQPKVMESHITTVILNNIIGQDLTKRMQEILSQSLNENLHDYKPAIKNLLRSSSDFESISFFRNIDWIIYAHSGISPNKIYV